MAADEGLKSHLSPDTPDHHTVNGPLSSVSTGKHMKSFLIEYIHVLLIV